jgi:hypothetical protein
MNRKQWKQVWSMVRSHNNSSAHLANIFGISHIAAANVLCNAWACRVSRDKQPGRGLDSRKFMLL